MSKIQKMILPALIFLILNVSCSGNISPLHLTEQDNSNRTNMTERHSNIKAATVRILVDQKARGTGFLVSEDGLIVTCFHVVGGPYKTPQGKISVKYSENIKIELSSGQMYDATPTNPKDQDFLKDAFSKDYALLKIEKNGLPYLPLGKFSDAIEGSAIYICGFPFKAPHPVVAKGMLSTKWEDQNSLGVGTPRDVAWLDVTMNQGNSGGPVVLIDDNPNNDKVIGIAAFYLNPYAVYARELAEFARNTRSLGEVKIMGINIGKFAELTGEAIAATSLGVGGCISIDYVRQKIF